MKRELVIASALVFCTGVMGCSSPQKQANQTQPPASQKAAPAPQATATSTQNSKAASQTNSVTCKRSGDERTLSIDALQPKGCKLSYSKFGHSSDIASSSIGPAHCETVRRRIKEKLEGSGFSCQ